MIKANEACKSAKKNIELKEQQIVEKFNNKIKDILLEEVDEKIKSAIKKGRFSCQYKVEGKYSEYIYLLIEEIEKNKYRVHKENDYNGGYVLNISWFGVTK